MADIRLCDTCERSPSKNCWCERPSPEQGVGAQRFNTGQIINAQEDGFWVRFPDYQAERERREAAEAKLKAIEGVVEELRRWDVVVDAFNRMEARIDRALKDSAA